jgi:hypothetical protein
VQFARVEHLFDDVAAADQFTGDIQIYA